MSTKATDKYATPPEVFDALDRAFAFTVDLCAERKTAKCRDWYGPGGLLEDSHEFRRLPLSVDTQTVWCNPPYSQPNIAEFCVTCRALASQGHTVCMLVPYTPETGWWREHASTACEVWSIYPRIQFILDGERKTGNPHPSALIVWTPWSDGPPSVKSWTWKTETAGGAL
jgi:phage N-6-adenine-methyltransferase